jgi:hypothetical protein
MVRFCGKTKLSGGVKQKKTMTGTKSSFYRLFTLFYRLQADGA